MSARLRRVVIAAAGGALVGVLVWLAVGIPLILLQESTGRWPRPWRLATFGVTVAVGAFAGSWAARRFARRHTWLAPIGASFLIALMFALPSLIQRNQSSLLWLGLVALAVGPGLVVGYATRSAADEGPIRDTEESRAELTSVSLLEVARSEQERIRRGIPEASPPVVRSFLDKTGQTWKRRVYLGLLYPGSALVIASCFWAPEAPNLHGQAVGTILILIAFAFAALALRCPRCKCKVAWHAWSHASHGHSTMLALYGVACPRCGYDPDRTEAAEQSAPVGA